MLWLLLLLFASFSHHYYLMVFHWSPRDSKSPQVSWSLLSILVDLNNAIVWVVSALPPIFNSSSSLIKPLGSFQEHRLQLVPPSPMTFLAVPQLFSIYYYYHYYFTPWMFLIHVLTGCLSLESECPRVFSWV